MGTLVCAGSQDTELGGIADRAGDMPDVFHTLFGVAGKLTFFFSLKNSFNTISN